MCIILGQFGIPIEHIDIIIMLYEGYSAQVLHNRRLSRKIEIQSGVCQGYVMSPTLFVILVHWIMEKSSEK